MAAAIDETFVGPRGEKRLRHKELIIPIVVGTCAFYLGKKATETQSHRWNLYVRGINGDDISHVIKKVVFNLHPTFPNPTREVAHHPFELEEYGWGEFELNVTLHFADDAQEQPVDVFHKLKLYSDIDPTNQTTKKPVVNEQYEELVFSEPVQGFYERVSGVAPSTAQPLPAIAPHFRAFDPADDLAKLTAARQRVANMSANLQRQINNLA